MAKGGINKVIIVGRIGKDPEIRYLPNGDAVTTMSVATSESWTDKTTGQKQEKTEWHRVTLWRKLGEIAGEYCKKGAQVCIEGKLSTRKWEDSNGVERYTTEIVADDMLLLGGKRDSVEEPSNANAASMAAQTPQATKTYNPPASSDFEGDIPF